MPSSSPIVASNGSDKKKGFLSRVKNFKGSKNGNDKYSAIPACKNGIEKNTMFGSLLNSLKPEKNRNLIKVVETKTKTSPIVACNGFEKSVPSPVEDNVLDVDDDSLSERAVSESESESESGEDQLEVIPLLSNNGKTSSLVRSNGDVVGFDVIRGKYLVICCVSLPVMIRSPVADYCRSMIDAYGELKICEHEVEMVVVARMKSGFTEDEAVFNNFFSEFPCLAIPFSQVETRDCIFSFIGSNSDISTIVVDPTGIILNHCDAHVFFHKYGSEWFPFNKSNLKAIDTQDEVFRIRLDPFYEKQYKNLPKAVMEDPLLREPMSLYKDILQCSPSHILPRFCYCDGPDAYMSVSQLSKRYVGLYLCVDGEFMETLSETHQHCIANNQQLDIVLVCVSLFEDPKSYMEKITRALEDCNVTSWFIFLYDSKVCRWLMRVFGQKLDSDRFIILPPNCKSGELEGRAVISQFGAKEYPFTRSSIFERRLTTLRSLTPASWFSGTREKRTYLYCNGRKSSLRKSEIRSRKLLLYLDWFNLSEDDGELCRLLMKYYRKFLTKGWKVVFVPLDDEDKGVRHAIFSKMPWPIMSLSAVIKCSVINQLLFQEELPRNQIFAVHRNGRVLSRRFGEKLKKKGFNKSLFHDKLQKEIAAPLILIKDE